VPTPKSSKPLIELSHCSLILDDRTVLDDVSFALRPGERWALVGSNGSGKTMLLKMLRGDMWPTPTGRERRTYAVDGGAGSASPGSKELIAYVGPERQDKYIRYDWNLTVTEVVTTGLFNEDIPLTTPTSRQREKVERVLRRFSLWGLRRRRLLTLSYGQRRLALIARAFASPARVLVLDEVFNGLDARVRQKLLLALEQPRGGHEWVLTSHRPQELPKSITHLARIEAGRIVASGTARRKNGVLFSADPKSGPAPSPGPKGRTPLAGQGREGASRRPQAPLVRIANAAIYRDYRLVIRDLNWTLNRGEHWAVLGANGSGKSTVLSLIYGDLHPALGGTIERQGVPAGTRIEEWKYRVGWVSPELQADHYLAKSIEEIVISGRYASVGLNSPPTAADRRAALRWLKFFAIESLLDRGPRQVSYGQMRLALIARAMVNNPELLLLDEPCTGLDRDVRAQVLAVLQRLAESGTQIVMAVHDAEDIVPAVRRVLKISNHSCVATAL
jgi:molybdate transport system ATP-binding protein